MTPTQIYIAGLLATLFVLSLLMRPYDSKGEWPPVATLGAAILWPAFWALTAMLVVYRAIYGWGTRR